MSFQLKQQSQPQTNLPLASSDHITTLHDGVLVSRLIPITLNLFDTKQSPPRLELLDTFSKKNQRKRSFDDHNCEEKMNRKNGNNKMPRLDLKLNLSPSSSNELVNQQEESPNRLSSSISPTSSCVSSESSPKATTSMVLVGCPRCLMYVMLSQDDPKCPKCKSTVLLDFLLDNNHHNHHEKGDDRDDNDNNRYNNGCFKKLRKSLFF